MTGKTNLQLLIKTMNPVLNPGEYVFCTVDESFEISSKELIGSFKEEEGATVIINKQLADKLALPYSFIAAWITLKVHSSLDAIGLTAAFSKALSDANISCNVVAAFYHDHIFIASKDAEKAMKVLKTLSHTNG